MNDTPDDATIRVDIDLDDLIPRPRRSPEDAWPGAGSASTPS
ncbi:hypothetical protein [Labedaea rhizosphaerae]|uniref:Uncharacterized protein n=1 Tax=Labedaea rhizosphaerae TaxID=598644 RepID=A0A4R6SNY9_LABRH|nr:hypothetical protein [Labedaea rhizosphaerae]TDQ05879.1 hypothetical protein EV186_1011857 [Labedaea rhizosphaerae]